MQLIGAGKRITIYLGESDHWQGKPLYLALLETLKKAGLAGATVTRGAAGFGAHSRIHIASIERLSEDLPLIVQIVDIPEQIEKALALVAPMVREGLITVDEVEIFKYTHRYLQPLPGDKLVGDVMTREVQFVSPDTSLDSVLNLMLTHMLKAVPVLDAHRQVLGILTDGNLLSRGGVQARLSVMERLDKATLQAQFNSLLEEGKSVQEVMTTPVITLPETAALAYATRQMAEYKLKRFPVVDAQGRLVGMLSRVDVLRTVVEARPEPGRSALVKAGQTVGEVMDHNVPLVSMETQLADVVEKMVSAGLKRVIVVDEARKALGMITDGDLVARIAPEARFGLLQALVRRLRGKPQLPEVTAAQLMSPGVLSGPPDTSIVDAIQQMIAQKRKRFLVVDEGGKPLGMVDRQILLRAVIGVE